MPGARSLTDPCRAHSPRLINRGQRPHAVFRLVVVLDLEQIPDVCHIQRRTLDDLDEELLVDGMVLDVESETHTFGFFGSDSGCSARAVSIISLTQRTACSEVMSGWSRPWRTTEGSTKRRDLERLLLGCGRASGTAEKFRFVDMVLGF